MKIAIMQPYLLPYIGYFQLIAASDLFVVYDNIQYTKKGWINRNRLLMNGTDKVFTLALQKASDHLEIRDRYVAEDFNRSKVLNQFKGGYFKAPFFKQTFALLEEVFNFKEPNLFEFIRHALTLTLGQLDITTKVIISSDVKAEHQATGEDRVLSICKSLGATSYLNPNGGRALYDKKRFSELGIDLRFLETMPFEYAQFSGPFIPNLSIIDVMMFNPPNTVRELITTKYEEA